ncbi:MAG: extensin family protein [Hyphomicrobium aestuarii]|nr:extensin family protein [Hyphomicrobium aestuarii]
MIGLAQITAARGMAFALAAWMLCAVAVAAPLEAWSDAEMSAARDTCTKLLAPLDVKFESVAPIRDGRCGGPALVRLSHVAGVAFTPAVVVNCPMAAAIHGWVGRAVQPAADDLLGSTVTRLSNVNGYACRKVRGEDYVSEHATGNALDVGAFVTADRRTITVVRHFIPAPRPVIPVPAVVTPTNRSEKTKSAAAGEGPPHPLLTPPLSQITPEHAFLKRIHSSGCGIFGTVLGPDADGDHRDHFHFDLAEDNGVCE